jgi:hypothetical protein
VGWGYNTVFLRHTFWPLGVVFSGH